MLPFQSLDQLPLVGPEEVKKWKANPDDDHRLSLRGFETGGINDGPEMNDPTKKKPPQESRREKHDDGQNPTPLKKLPQPCDEKTAKGRQYIAAGSWTCHATIIWRNHHHLSIFVNNKGGIAGIYTGLKEM